MRTRTVFYAVALTLVSGLMVWGLLNRHLTDLHVLRDRNPTFVRLHDGAVRDGYTIKIDNRTFGDRTFEIGLEGLPGAALKTPGQEGVARSLSIAVEANQVRAVRVSVIAPPSAIKADNMPIAFTLRSGELTARAPTIFLSGAANAR